MFSSVRVLTTRLEHIFMLEDELQHGKAILRLVDDLAHTGQLLEASVPFRSSGLTSRR